MKGHLRIVLAAAVFSVPSLAAIAQRATTGNAPASDNERPDNPMPAESKPRPKSA